MKTLAPVDLKAVAAEGCFVYCYLRARDSATGKAGTPYYVGFASRAERPTDRHGACVPSDRSLIRVLKSGLSKEEAFACERFFIARYGRKDLGVGILRNLTDGGEGPVGWSPNAETRARMGEWQKGRKRSPSEMRGIIAQAREREVVAACKYGVCLDLYRSMTLRARSNMKRWIRENPGATGADYLRLQQRGTDPKTRQAHRAISALLSYGFSAEDAERLQQALTRKEREAIAKHLKRAKSPDCYRFARERGWLESA